jgi:hypothetical protein
MLNLALTTDKLQITTSSTAAIDVHCSFVDRSSDGLTITPGKQNTAISSAATTDVVAVPGASTVRNIKTINARNKDASASNDLTVIYNANGTSYELFKATVRSGEHLEYIEGVGWFVISSDTAKFRTLKLGSDDAKTSTTPATVSGLTIATGVGTFIFEYFIVHQTAATTTGHKESVNHTGTVTAFNYWDEIVSATTTASDGAQSQAVALTTGGLINVNAGRAKSTAGLGAYVSGDTINADLLTIIRGITTVTVDGNLELYWATEVAASASTVKAGSALRLTRTD